MSDNGPYVSARDPFFCGGEGVTIDSKKGVADWMSQRYANPVFLYFKMVKRNIYNDLSLLSYKNTMDIPGMWGEKSKSLPVGRRGK